MSLKEQLGKIARTSLLAGATLIGDYVQAQNVENEKPNGIRSAYIFSPDKITYDLGFGNGIMDEDFKVRRIDDISGNTDYVFGARFKPNDLNTLWLTGSTVENGVGLESKTLIGDKVLDASLSKTEDSLRTGFGLTKEFSDSQIGIGFDYLDLNGAKKHSFLEM
ncbi:MAG: hypothetical protein AABW71_00125 [Nanoarchaeota archaeon]